MGSPVVDPADGETRDSGHAFAEVEYDQAKAHLEDCLALAGNAHTIYMSIDDSLRRICNHAFFERIDVYEIEDTDTVLADHGDPSTYSSTPHSTQKPSPTSSDYKRRMLNPDMSRV